MNIKDKISPIDCTSSQKKLKRLYEDGIPHIGKITGIITRTDGTIEEIAPSYNSRVNAGATSESNVLFVTVGSTSTFASFQFIGLTATTITPAATDTTLSGEITANGCARALCSVAYTAPASVGATYTATFTHTWTCATAPQTVNSIGLFNQLAVGGTMFSEAALATTASLAIGDTLALTYSVNS
jgi:hypothetical protein